MDFKNYLKEAAEEIDKELEIFFKKWSEEVLTCSPKLSDLNKSFIRANEGGKRLRGALVMLGFELAGGRKNLEILKPAAAFEIFQTAILAHDDIIDLSPLRRGKPTLYRTLGGDHYGISQTICLGDIGFFLAQKLIDESNFDEKLKNRALASFVETMLQTGLGQMLDIELPRSKNKKSEADILQVFRLKTARYTLVGPLHLGAILAGADEKMLENLTRFGESLGIAFQIQDDILGVFGDEETLGKSVTSDIEEGKITLLYLYALENGGKRVLGKYYGKKVRDVRGVEEIREVLKKTRALEYSQKKAEKLVSEAKKIIPQLTANVKQQTILSEMADLLVKRNK